MAATPYKPTTFTNDALTRDKLLQMANNDQWLFENLTKVRYSANGLVRDTGVKIIAGKTPYAAVGADYQYISIHFGSFFSAGCRPVVTGSVQPGGVRKRINFSVTGLGGTSSEPDNSGFMAVLWTTERVVGTTIDASGMVHWQAVGY